MHKQDPFGGAWELNSEKSRFDPNHRPTSGIMRWHRTLEGYQMTAEGTAADGQIVRERQTTFILDGKERPVLNVPGLTVVVLQPVPNTVEVESKHLGRVAGKASYVVSEDGTTLTASVSGTDAQQRPFQTVLVWTRL